MNNLEGRIRAYVELLRGPRGGRYLMLLGAALMIFGCIAVQISNAIAQASPVESTGAFVAGVILAIAFLVLAAGVVVALIGAVMHIYQSARARTGMQ